MSKLKRLRVVVEGRVQGVYYRASTQQQAKLLALTGWVKNLPDGAVEFEAQGTYAQLDQLVGWAKQGPKHAMVNQLTQQEIPPLQQEAGFSIRY